MKKRIQTLLLGGFFVLFAAAPMTAITFPQPVMADAKCETRVLGIPPWYRGLTSDYPKCLIDSPAKAGKADGKEGVHLSNFIWKIALNIVEMIIVITAYVTVFFIIYGGFQFITGGSNPGMIEKGRKTITNAAIGLAISMAAIAIVNIIFSII